MSRVEALVMHYAAPAICGIKPSNLFSVKESDLRLGSGTLAKFADEFRTEGLTVAVLGRQCGNTLLFVYDKRLLEEILKIPGAEEYLAEKGYRVSEGISSVLSEMFGRICAGKDFPHEIGLFLGYPLRDVILFDRKSGTGCEYSGYWKSYGDTEKAKAACTLYRECSGKCCELYRQGKRISEIRRSYRTAGAKICGSN